MNTTKFSEQLHSRERNIFARKNALAAAVACALAIAGFQTNAVAGPREQAATIYNRLVGAPPSDADLTSMAAQITGGDALGAALSAIDAQNPNAGPFYTYTLKNFAAPMTNRAGDVFVPLNDYTATVIGMVRDDVPYNTVLSADILYVADAASGAPAYSPANNNMYAFLDTNNVDLRQHLTKTTQSSLNGLPVAATAGVMTTAAGAGAYFINGTNRAMFRFTMLNHLCHDMEQVQDTTRPADLIRQDVARSPGGDSRIFLNSCIGCHSGMDPMARAFAYYNFDTTSNQLVYTAGQVQPKYFINSDNFKPGYVTTDDQWFNRWRSGPNSVLGWSSQLPGSGSGAKSLGQELASSDAFAQCQVEKVFKQVCFRAPSNSQDRAQVTQIKGDFVSNNYSLKRVFAETAVYCMGQ